MNFRVLVTGSRSWKDTEAVHTALDAMAHAAARSGYDGLTVVHGGAKGADTSAALWVTDGKRRGWPVAAEPHPVSGADWKQYGNGAGMRRNREMVRLGADACLAFINPCEVDRCRRARPHGTHGATDCADLAEASDIHTVRITPRTDSPPAGA
jgi:hypothetical protein